MKPLETRKIGDGKMNKIIDELSVAGYWDEFCFVCQTHTYQPEGFCSVCGWCDYLNDYMTEREYKNRETLDDVFARVDARFDNNRIAAKKK